MRSLLLILATAIGLQGCNSASDGRPHVESEVESPAASVEGAVAAEAMPSSDAPSADKVELKILDWEATQNLVKQNAGKIVVLDIWATYCPPCVDEFPHLVKLHETHGDKVACISVSLDFDGTGKPVESYREKVLNFLTQQKATFPNVLLSIDPETLFTHKIAHQSLPIVMVFDRDGFLAAEFPDPKDPDEFTYEKHVIPAVQKLLAAE